ncbi:MAG TPA: hypothetical protein VJB97_03355 [Candidatus Paceibacterota bacterium]
MDTTSLLVNAIVEDIEAMDKYKKGSLSHDLIAYCRLAQIVGEKLEAALRDKWREALLQRFKYFNYLDLKSHGDVHRGLLALGWKG